VAIPVVTLRAELRLEVVRTLFPADLRVTDGWLHWVVDPFGGGEESWSWLAELFAGSGEAAKRLRAANPEQPEDRPRRGGQLVVPSAVLLDVFRQLEAVATPAPAPRPSPTGVPTFAEAGPLSYGTDDQGRFALYRLQKGEALYSAVVVRFTGQVYAKQVNATAAEIARRSGIDDVTEIPIGYPIKIPLDLLLPRFLPFDHPLRLEWEEERRELVDFLEVVKATDLRGVHVIIDAGHGGADTGAIVDGLWEAAYVYDIACRIKANLERHTQAEVWVTRQDSKRGFQVPAVDRLPQHREQILLTRPNYPLEDSVLGVHLRWYLANDIILNRLGSKVPRSKTVFLSVHADSLHPTVRGAMVYVPSRYLRPSTYTVQRRDIQRYAEYRNHPTVRLGPEFKARVEASSRHLAENMITTIERNGIMVHPDDPVRDRVLRGRRSWVPAVLRYNAAQNAVLVECCNMSNDDDRALLVDQRWREQFARAVVEGTASAFSGS
jgi:N-acetylmuramoyl-L-alanine amidase